MTRPHLKLIPKDEGGPSWRFLNLTRKVDLPSPSRFEPTVKRKNDVVI